MAMSILKSRAQNPKTPMEMDKKIRRELTHVLAFRAKEPKTLLNQTFELQGRLLTDSPNRDLDMNFDRSSLMILLVQFKTWVEDRLPLDLIQQSETSKARFNYWTKQFPDYVYGTVSCAPLPWLQGDDPKGQEKIFSFLCFIAIGFLFDDVLERLAGQPEYPAYIDLVARVTYKALTLEYSSKEEMLQELKDGGHRLGLDAACMQMNHFICLWQDLAADYQTNFGVSGRAAKRMAKAMRLFVVFNCWLDDGQKTYLKNLSLWRTVRRHTVASNIVIEYYYMMDGLLEDPAVRRFVKDEIHLTRMTQLAVDISGLLNDTCSFTREAEEEEATGVPAENRIILYHRVQGLSFPDCVKKATRIHNEKMRELHEIAVFLENKCLGVINKGERGDTIGGPGNRAGAETMLKAVRYIFYYAGSMLRVHSQMAARYGNLEWEVQEVNSDFVN